MSGCSGHEGETVTPRLSSSSRAALRASRAAARSQGRHMRRASREAALTTLCFVGLLSPQRPDAPTPSVSRHATRKAVAKRYSTSVRTARASKKVERVWKELHMQWQLAAPAASRASPRQPQVPLQRQGSQPRAVYCMNGVLLGAFILNAVVTYTYGVHGSFGETAASQLEAFPTLVTPAAWSFSIWAVIFVGEGAFALVQLCTRRFNFADKEEVRTIAPWFLSVCVCQALWTVAIAQPLSSEGQSTWYVWLSLGLMLALWASLYGPPAPHRTDRPADPMPSRPDSEPASPASPLPRHAPCSLTHIWLLRVAALMWLQAGIYSDAPRPSWSRWALFHLPFQLHAAWATAALVVNVNVVLVADAARAARGDLALFAAVLSLVRRPAHTRQPLTTAPDCLWALPLAPGPEPWRAVARGPLPPTPTATPTHPHPVRRGTPPPQTPTPSRPPPSLFRQKANVE